MPMKSEAQRRYLHSQKPGIAKEFEKATPKDAKLPEKARKEAYKSYKKNG